MSTSRYDPTKTAEHLTPDGRTIVYLQRRFLPQPENMAVLHERVLTEGSQRLDIVAAEELGDPEFFWQICDANRAMKPEELEVIGRRLKITLPEGMPAPPDF